MSQAEAHGNRFTTGSRKKTEAKEVGIPTFPALKDKSNLTFPKLEALENQPSKREVTEHKFYVEVGDDELYAKATSQLLAHLQNMIIAARDQPRAPGMEQALDKEIKKKIAKLLEQLCQICLRIAWTKCEPYIQRVAELERRHVVMKARLTHSIAHHCREIESWRDENRVCEYPVDDGFPLQYREAEETKQAYWYDPVLYLDNNCKEVLGIEKDLIEEIVRAKVKFELSKPGERKPPPDLPKEESPTNKKDMVPKEDFDRLREKVMKLEKENEGLNRTKKELEAEVKRLEKELEEMEKQMH